MVAMEVRTLQGIQGFLSSKLKSLDDYQQHLEKVGLVVNKTLLDDQYRQSLAENIAVWRQLRDNLRDLNSENGNDEEIYWYLRLIRAQVLLMRNLTVANRKHVLDLDIPNLTIRMYMNLIHDYGFKLTEITVALYAMTLEFICNTTGEPFPCSSFDVTNVSSFLALPLTQAPLEYTSNLWKKQYLALLRNFTSNDEFLYHAFRNNEFEHMIYTIVKIQGPGILLDDSRDISDKDMIYLQVIRNLSYNETFGNYLSQVQLNDVTKFRFYLESLQALITSLHNWDKFEVIGILNWCFPAFCILQQDVLDYFASQIEDDRIAQSLHDNINSILDVLIHLGTYNHAQEFIISYGGVDHLIALLECLQKNLWRVNFSKVGKEIETNGLTLNYSDIKIHEQMKRRVTLNAKTIKPTNFPETKTLIIELLTLLTYQNVEVQDKMRELHGLELILSNCVIDNNDPFIKERSIMCIRFLLENNQSNQDFVAKLEARKAVQDETLQEAGYEISLTNEGNVVLNANHNFRPNSGTETKKHRVSKK